MKDYQEINFDGLVGPTHHYGGLSGDNLASDSNRDATSNPKKAALQGLEKMKALHDSGFPQAVLPPLRRPSIETLRALGFGTQADNDQVILQKALDTAPHLLSAVSSASSMWTANAATIAPSVDTADSNLHLVTANLTSKLHRSIEGPNTYNNLRRIFGPFATVSALPGGQAMGDEGAANHTRLSITYGTPGIHVFVYGRDGASDTITNQRFLGRQTLQASKAVARLLKLGSNQTVYIQQNQEVIDAGVFHNDVIAVGNLDCYFSHQNAYTEGEEALEMISDAFQRTNGSKLNHIVVPDKLISVGKAVETYLFNSQLVGPSGNMTLIAPQECREDPIVSDYLESLCHNIEAPINHVRYFDLRESMRNGGGPACLRLRVIMNEAEKQALGARVLLDDALYDELVSWVDQHYRDSLTLPDIADSTFCEEITVAFDELSKILQLHID